MDQQQFLAGVYPLIGGQGNVNRPYFRSGELVVTVKDRSAVGPEQINALCKLEGVAGAELCRSSLKITVQQNYWEELNMAKTKEKVDYQSLAKEIIAKVGGKDNVVSLRHCVTRCRFTLKDEKLAKDEEIRAMPGVVGVAHGGGEYMVIIGATVVEVYDALCAELGLTGDAALPDTEKKKGGNPVMNLINTIVGAVAPALNLICAGGIMKGLLTVLSATGLLAADSGLYTLLSAVGDAVFFFLPIILGYNLAKHLRGDAFMGLLIGAIMCYPSLQGVDLNLFGFTTNATYTNSFLPVVAVVAVAVPISKLVGKIIPKVIAGFLVPVITLIIVMPLGFLVIGPLMTALGNVVNAGITALLSAAPILAGIVFGGLYQVMVLFGIHSAVTSFSFMNVVSGHPDAVMAMCAYPCFAQIGVVLAMYLKTKNQKLKEVALPAFISGIFGVTEPAIYGVTLPHIKMFVISCIGAAVPGAIIMAMNLKYYALTGLGIFSPLGMIGAEQTSFVLPYMIAVITFVVSFALAFVLYKDEA